MKLRIEKGSAEGTVSAPPSKSMAHRLLICAGLSDSPCTVHGISESQDMLATLDCLAALGAEYEKEGDTVRFSSGIAACGKNSCRGGLSSAESSQGSDGQESGSCGQRGTAAGEAAADAAAAQVLLPCRESGSTLRFFVPIALLSGQRTVFTGSERLMERPQSVYEKLCGEQGFTFERQGSELLVHGRLKAGEYELRGDVSSQFVTGLLLALPLTDGDSRICLIPPVESRSYIDMTISALETFGVKAVWESENQIYIKGGQSYNADEVFVEGDYSNAAFFEALNIIDGYIATIQNVIVENLREDSLQGDRVYRKLFKILSDNAARAAAAVGAIDGSGNPDLEAIELSGKPELEAIDIADCPDLGPVLMAVAAALGGGRFTGTKRLKIKESDRGEAMAAELRKFGVSVTVGENDITVGNEGLHPPKELLYGHNDHRIVMSEAVLLTQTGGIIEGAEAVSKSFPSFFEELTSLGIEVKRIED